MYTIHRNADKPIPELLAAEIQDDTLLGAHALHSVFSALSEYAGQIGMTDDAAIFAEYAAGWDLK